MKEGEKGKVTRIDRNIKRLIEMGIVRGVDIELIRKDPLGDPIEIHLKGYNLTLRKNEAEKIWVKI